MLQSALRFYQDFLKERNDDPVVRAALAAAFVRVGRINTELNSIADARSSIDAAIGYYESALAGDSTNIDLKAGLADAWNALGELYFTRNPVESQKGYQKAADIYGELTRENPEP